MKIQKFEYLENEKSFLDKKKHFSYCLKDYHLVKNKNLIKNSRHKLYVLQCSGRFITCMGVLCLTVELDNLIQLSTFSRMSGFLWHNSK